MSAGNAIKTSSFYKNMMTKTQYTKEIVPKLIARLHIGNRNAVPQMVKIIVNCGIGAEAQLNKKVLESMSSQLAVITGQKPIVMKARKAISSFKLRQGDPVGIKVTLRGKRMYDFLTRLVAIALPRVRDFRGISKSGFDKTGNYTLGITEQTIFPELDYALVDRVRGFEATFVTTAKNDEEAKTLLALLGMPFET